MQSTAALDNHCPNSWESDAALSHRRTLILFNQLHSEGDGLGFQAWLASPELWTISEAFNVSEDNEITAMNFVHRLTCKIWEEVVSEWKKVIDQCSEHIR